MNATEIQYTQEFLQKTLTDLRNLGAGVSTDFLEETVRSTVWKLCFGDTRTVPCSWAHAPATIPKKYIHEQEWHTNAYCWTRGYYVVFALSQFLMHEKSIQIWISKDLPTTDEQLCENLQDISTKLPVAFALGESGGEKGYWVTVSKKELKT